MKIPKPYTTITGSVLILLGISLLVNPINTFLQNYVDTNITVDIPFGILLPIIGLIVIMIGLNYDRLFSPTRKRETNNTLIPEKKTTLIPKKQLPREFEIETLNNGRIEWKVIVKTCWNPNEKPQIEDFVYHLKLLEPYCGKCKSSFVESTSHPDIICNCSNPDCESFQTKQIFKKHEQINFWGDIMLKQLKGRIRKDDFDKYWDKYVTRYDEVTGGKYDEYD
ncbi:MAG: hypothetical protein QQN49_05775 [Nitrosopumilus sp.]